MTDFNFFLPIAKVDKDRRTVSGYASTPAIDLDGEVVTREAVQKALPGYWQWRNIREMHTSSAVGVAKEANIDETGLFLTAKIIDDEAWNKCLEGVYKGFSIGGRKLAKTGNTITEIELIEISVVDRPANPECRFEVQKSAKDGGGAYLLKSSFRKDNKNIAINKMAEAVQALTEENSESSETNDTNNEPEINKAIKTPEKSPTKSAEPPFLNLSVDGGARDAEDKIGFSHESDLGKGGKTNDFVNLDNKFLHLIKRKEDKMSDLNGVLEFLLKAAGESGEKTDKNARMNVARENLKKAKKAAKDMEESIKAAHAMHKAAYLAKTANVEKRKKTDDDEEFDHQGAMEKLSKAYSDLSAVKTFIKAANVNLKKSMETTPVDGSTGPVSPDNAPGDMFCLDGPAIKNAKPSGDDVLTKREHEALVEAARAKAEAELLKSMPIGPVHGKRPATFDVAKALTSDGASSESKLWNGVNKSAIGSENEAAHNDAVGTLVGNMILGGFGKSIFDTNFRGTAGTTKN